MNSKIHSKQVRRLDIKSLVLLFFVAIMGSCGTSKEFNQEEINKLEHYVNEKNFRIEFMWARPFATHSLNQIANAGLLAPGDNANQINMQGFSSVFKFRGDTVIADLPYFGERQMGGGYNSNDGIQFNGSPRDLQIIKNEKKNSYSLNFKISEGAENFQVNLIMYSNLSTSLNITSSQRFRITYDGHIKDLEEEAVGD